MRLEGQGVARERATVTQANRSELAAGLVRQAGPARVPAGAVTATTAAFVLCMAGTTLPTPLYDIYSRRFGFHTLIITVLFAVYAVGVVVTLALLGRLSDAVGRRPVILAAVVISVLASLILAAAQGLGYGGALTLLLVGRVVSGLAAGLMSGTGTAAIIDLFPPRRRGTAGTIAVAANTGGLALGTALAGLLAEVASHPLVTPYLAQAALGILAAAAFLAATRKADSGTGSRFRFSRPVVPAEIRASFLRAVLAGGAAFAVLGVLNSVSSVFLATVLHDDNHLLAGGVVAIVFACMAVGQLGGKRLEPHAAMLLGCCGLAVAGAVLLLALSLHSLPALLVAAVTLGSSGGICMNAGVASTVEQVPTAQRGEVSSSYFAGLYVLLACPAIGVGLLAAHTSLIAAGVTFCVLVIALVVGVAIAESRHG